MLDASTIPYGLVFTLQFSVTISRGLFLSVGDGYALVIVDPSIPIVNLATGSTTGLKCVVLREITWLLLRIRTLP